MYHFPPALQGLSPALSLRTHAAAIRTARGEIAGKVKELEASGAFDIHPMFD